jgi:hypothetical protein
LGAKIYSIASNFYRYAARFDKNGSKKKILPLLCTRTLQRRYEPVASCRREGQPVVLEVVHDVRVLLLEVADDGLLPGRRVQHDAHHARAEVLEHVVGARQLPVGALQVQRQRRHGGAAPERRHGQREAEVQRGALHAAGREPDLRRERRPHGLVQVLRERRDRRAGVDDRRAATRRWHGDARRAHRDGHQREEVERRLRGVPEERGAPDLADVRVAVERGRRAAERDEAALGLEHGGETVGEACDVELGRKRPPPPAEPRNAGLVRLEHALVEVAAPEGQAPGGEAAGIAAAAVSEGEAVGRELADGERLVPVVVGVDAGPVAPAAAAARRELERAAPGRAAGERGVGGRRRRVQEREALAEAVAAGRALRPHEVAPRVERERHGPWRRAHGQAHQVLVRHDAAAAAEPGAHPRAHRALGLGQQPPARPGAVRHAPDELGPREAAAGVGVREQRRHHAGAGGGARGARQRDQDQQRREPLHAY